MSNIKFSLLSQAFARRHSDLLRFLVRRVGSQDAPDLLQETYLRVLRHAGSKSITEPQALLFTTAVNLAKNHRSRRATEQKYLEFGELPQDLPESRPLQDDQVDARRRLRLLDEAIQALPPRCRQVFTMLRLDELPPEEVARQLGISRNMVQQHLQLALKRCHEALD
ncbi:RNA polymerase sigma factor [Methylocapsa acidiphila]|uniref:RNA polymerase sigma factor n=1 Tax=Methylocapsa acidiphila TaxID=133552 RepID=UPI00047CCA5A|nr:RNA polymerase sigma factor [Methylocapsa acidiphila]